MWVPLALRRGATPPDERRFWYQAHLAPGVTLEEASRRHDGDRAAARPVVSRRVSGAHPRGRARPALPRRRQVQQRAVHAARRRRAAPAHRVLQRRQHAAGASHDARAGDDAARGARRRQAAPHGAAADRVRSAGARWRRWRLPAGVGRHPRGREHPAAAGHRRRGAAAAGARSADREPGAGGGHDTCRRPRARRGTPRARTSPTG